MSEETGHSVLLQAKIGSDDRTIVFSLPYIKEPIQVGVVFKALGFVEEDEIIDIIGNEDEKIQKYIKYIIRDSYFIKTQDDALKYIGQFSMHVIKDDKRKDYAAQVVENEYIELKKGDVGETNKAMVVEVSNGEKDVKFIEEENVVMEVEKPVEEPIQEQQVIEEPKIEEVITETVTEEPTKEEIQETIDALQILADDGNEAAIETIEALKLLL
jgi:hypothetical protein